MGQGQGRRRAEPEDEYWDQVVVGWEPSVAHRLWRAHSDAVNIALLRRWLGGGNRSVLKTDLFDEAVGAGLYPELAARAGEVVGVDVSAAAVHAASRRYPDLETLVGSVLALPFPDGRFDAIVSNSTLDHFATHAKLKVAVRELERVLAPGGRLIITLDNRANPIVALRTSSLSGLFRRLRAVPYFVGATYGPRGLSALLRESAFSVLAETSIMHCPPQVAAELTARLSDSSIADDEATSRHLSRALRFEMMERWPTRALTGHFAAAVALKT
jgi:SAM-dependent methyltransferase